MTVTENQSIAERPIKILLIEDDAGDADFIREILVKGNRRAFELEWVARLAEGLERLRQGGIDVVLLDLSLPDSHGLGALTRLHAQGPGVPTLVLTGMVDEASGVEAVRMGAQDYLVKGQVDRNVLVRTLRYAIERHRLKEELAQARQREQWARELHSLEQLSRSSATAVTAQSLGLVLLRESAPTPFDELVRRYGTLIERALEQRAYKVEHNVSEDLRAMAEQMGSLNASARDVVEVHTTALQRTLGGIVPQKAAACAEEARFLVLELMGRLVTFYRRYSFGIRRGPASDAHTRQGNKTAY